MNWAELVRSVSLEDLIEEESYGPNGCSTQDGGMCYGIRGGDVLKSVYIHASNVDRCIFHCHNFSCELRPVKIDNVSEWYVNIFIDSFPSIYLDSNIIPKVEIIGTHITRVVSQVQYINDSQRAKFGNVTIRKFDQLIVNTYEGPKLLINEWSRA